MKLFEASRISEWDEYTVRMHFENSLELMEIAAQACVDHIEEEEIATSYAIFCGTGNNGGDGLCIGRLLAHQDYQVKVYIVGDPDKGSDDFKNNLQLIITSDVEALFLSEKHADFDVTEHELVIDAIFGTGLSRPVDGWIEKLFATINSLPNRIISVDLPSGMMPDLLEAQHGTIIRADQTLTFQVPKRAFMFPENYEFIGNFDVLPIGLDADFEKAHDSDLLFYEETEAVIDFRQRKKFSHKNTFGHAHLIAGSKGKIGAAVLATRAALRAGAGLVTATVPQCGEGILQLSIPEAMCKTDEGTEVLKSTSFSAQYSATAIGPGIDQAPETALMLRRFLKDANSPLVIDADALNIIAGKNLHNDIPHNSIITPHVGEFDRLFGKHENSFDRLQTLKSKAAELNIVIVLKGAHTCIAYPTGDVTFNSSGNVGMATAGSGDALTGVLVALLAQGYPPAVAARLGVYIHGVAGDIAAPLKGYTGMIAGDIIHALPEAFLELEGTVAFFEGES